MWVAVRRMQLLRREPLGGGRVAARDRGALRATGTKDALNPVWGAQGIVFDRQRSRQGDAPVYNLWAIQPDGTGLRRVTRLKIPSMANGLVPLDLSADGGRLLAGFTGPDTLVGFTVDPQSGATRALSKDVEQALVGYDLSADGSTILGHTGGPDPVLPGAYAHGRHASPHVGHRRRRLEHDRARASVVVFSGSVQVAQLVAEDVDEHEHHGGTGLASDLECPACVAKALTEVVFVQAERLAVVGGVDEHHRQVSASLILQVGSVVGIQAAAVKRPELDEDVAGVQVDGQVGLGRFDEVEPVRVDRVVDVLQGDGLADHLELAVVQRLDDRVRHAQQEVGRLPELEDVPEQAGIAASLRDDDVHRSVDAAAEPLVQRFDVALVQIAVDLVEREDVDGVAFAFAGHWDAVDLEGRPVGSRTGPA